MRIFQVDAFTSEPFRGNSAGVCLLDEERDASWMQAVAMEMNLAETAFVRATGDAFSLRWFTPEVEVELCGHATLASAHVLWTQGVLPADEVARFDTLSGRLTATQNGAWIELDFPSARFAPVEAPVGMLEALGVKESLYVGRNRWDLLVEIADEQQVRALTPDFARLREVKARGVIVTSRGSGNHDFVSRFFGPAVGIDEDPVTGSAHCGLAPYWSEKLGREQLLGFQASARGGEVRTRLAGDRVLLGGQAVTVLAGELLV